MDKKIVMWVGIGIVIAILVIAGIFLFTPSDSGPSQERIWLSEDMVNVLTGETYSVSDFAGTPVLLESFAVWCPTCTAQQEITKEFHDLYGNQVISISLDTDPNEDQQAVINHANSNGFTWIYSVAPASVTQSLVDDFGNSIAFAPSVPMILVCEDQSNFKKLPGGLKSVDTLLNEISTTCGTTF